MFILLTKRRYLREVGDYCSEEVLSGWDLCEGCKEAANQRSESKEANRKFGFFDLLKMLFDRLETLNGIRDANWEAHNARGPEIREFRALSNSHFILLYYSSYKDGNIYIKNV